MSVEQRVRAMRRGARDSFYRWPEIYARNNVTNWRMIIARRLRIPIAEVRRILDGNDERLRAK